MMNLSVIIKTLQLLLLMRRLLLLLAAITIFSNGFGQLTDSIPDSRKLKMLSLEELMNIEITSVSKHPEKLLLAASAIQVITQYDIKNSGAKTLPEALRLAPNLQVAKVNSSQWAISARGFNNVLANKLLVLVDGRTVYTPLYAGVFWDIQNLLLEDIDRIEVISGPGGTLWGANAVNGVINIITKKAADTKGFYAEISSGTDQPVSAAVRYGTSISNSLSCRIYGTGFKMGSTLLKNDSSANDHWTMGQGGLRIDWDPSAKNKVTVQANIYNGRPNPEGKHAKPVIATGENIIAKWNLAIAENSEIQLQAYYDHSWRDFRNAFTEDLKTYDIDLQHRFRPAERHGLTWGINFRMMDHNVTNLALFAFLPGQKNLQLYSLFLQDEIKLVKEKLLFTIGAKIEHNSYTGFEYQPSGRFTWTPSGNQAIWGAVSRAIRTPARIDRDFFLSFAPGMPVFTGGNFVSEEVLAYELGWRVQPLQKLSVSVATFFNVYDNIRSAEPGPPPGPFPITIANGVKGKTYGAELSATCQLNSWWNLKGGYSFLKKKLSVKQGSSDLNKGTAESDDPEHQFLIQSAIDIPGGLQWGTVARYVGKLTNRYVPAFFAVDLRLGWKFCKIAELSIVAQNLLKEHHAEFIPSSPSPRDIERSIYGKITVRL